MIANETRNDVSELAVWFIDKREGVCGARDTPKKKKKSSQNESSREIYFWKEWIE